MCSAGRKGQGIKCRVSIKRRRLAGGTLREAGSPFEWQQASGACQLHLLRAHLPSNRQTGRLALYSPALAGEGERP